MMKELKSEKMTIPLVYLITSEKELMEIPMGIPFIKGDMKDYSMYVRLMEYEVLYRSAKASGLSFNWRKLLIEAGYTEEFIKAVAHSTFYLDSGEESEEECEDWTDKDRYTGIEMSKYLSDISYQVDLEALKELKIIPTWFTEIETAVKENILNSIVYNPNLYNKKLDLVSGSIDLNIPEKNLIIIDISGSIPISISKVILLLSKTMATQFYADLLITGSKSTLYEYENVDTLNVETIYQENGKDNDQVYFKKLVSEHRKYNTVIAFGDNHSPSMVWRNNYNKNCKAISLEDGKQINKWEVKKIISFHTTSSTEVAGYTHWFDTSDITYKKNWVTYLD